MKECTNLQTGERLGNYTIVRLLGKGGMGAVYLVHDEKGLSFAAKVMKLPDDDARREWRRRFVKEAGFAMTVHHKNLVAVHDTGEVGATGLCYIIMDYMPGGTLSDLLKRKGRLGVREAVDIAIAIASVLEVAHGVGAVHRDIKPDNILFDADGTPKLADMGIAKFGGGNSSTTVTATGMIVGTPAYMSPEQMMDSHCVDARADIYSLGLVLYEMLTGTRPHADSTAVELIAKAIKGEELPDIRTIRPEVSVALSYVLSLMVAVKPEERIASAMEAAKMLYDAATDRLVMKRRPARFSATAGNGRVRNVRTGLKTVVAWTIGGIMIISAIAVGGWWMNKSKNQDIRQTPQQDVPSKTSGGEVKSDGGNEVPVSTTKPSKSMAEKRNWEYTIHGTHAIITGVTPATGSIEIPSEIRDGDKTYVVTGIGDHAFNNAHGKEVDITSVTIPDSVTNIGALAFQSCRRLTTVKIGIGWTRYNRWVFNDCGMVKSFEVAKGNPAYASVNGLLLTKDGKTLIQGVNGNVTIPETVTNITGDAFVGCNNLLSIYVADSNPVYTSGNGLLLTKDGRTVVRGIDGDVVIPAGVTNIGDDAFRGRLGLTSVTMPNNVTNVGRWAFWCCRMLAKVTMPDSVKGIGRGAFDRCDRLISMTIPAGVTNIGAGAFSGCRGLNDFAVSSNNANYMFANGLLLSKDGKTLVAGVMVGEEVSIPNSVLHIEDSAFRACNNLVFVSIPNSVTDIGDSVFSQCDNLMDVTIPNSVTNIGNFAISDCRSLKSIELPDSVTRIGRQAFYGSGFTHFKIPDSVIHIGSHAFWGCYDLKNVTIGRSVRRLEAGALSYCSKLKRVTFLGDAPTLGDGVFRGVPSDCIVEVPCNSTGWDVDIPGKWQGMNIRYKDEVKEKPVVNAADFEKSTRSTCSTRLKK